MCESVVLEEGVVRVALVIGEGPVRVCQKGGERTGEREEREVKHVVAPVWWLAREAQDAKRLLGVTGSRLLAYTLVRFLPSCSLATNTPQLLSVGLFWDQAARRVEASAPRKS